MDGNFMGMFWDPVGMEVTLETAVGLHSRWFGPSVHGFEREAGWLWLAKSDKGIPKQPSLP